MPAPLQILLAWCLLLPAVCGLGFLAARALGPPGQLDVSLAFWLGTSAACLAAVTWHLFLPVDGRVWILLGPAAALGLALELRRCGTRALRSFRSDWPWLLPLAGFALWLAGRATLASTCPDDRLYYTQTVRWASTYPAVPGIGNLHPFLAFNHAYHLLVAAFGVGPFSWRGDRITNGLLLLAVVVACSRGLIRLLAAPAPARTDVLAAVLLGPALDFSLSSQLSCPAADFAVHMAGTGLLLAGFDPALQEAPETRWRPIVAACAGGILLKPSLICVAAPVALLAVRSGCAGGPVAHRLRCLGGAAVVFLAALVPWTAHGLVLSGYPLFPSSWPDPGVPWRMNPEVLAWIRGWIHAFARWPGHPDAEVRASAAWVVRWFGREWLENRAFLLPVATAVAGLLALLAARVAGKRPPLSLRGPLVSVGLGLAIWAGLAPDTRFAGPLLWAAAALSGLAALLAWRPLLDRRARFSIAAAALALALGAFAGWAPSISGLRQFPPLRHNLHTTRARLPSGETVDVAGEDGCWDPPCGWPPLDPRLRLRRPGHWDRGFTLEPP